VASIARPNGTALIIQASNEALSGALAHHLRDLRNDTKPGIRGQLVISRAALEEFRARFR
jgi:hypothetical protein